MGQFKPMVKMETTEPSVVLKLKKGGHVNKKNDAKAENGHKPMHKLDGGMMGDMGAMNAPAMIRPPVVGGPSIGSPRRPSMADRQKAMAMAKSMKSRRPPAAAPMGGLPTMKKGGKAGGEVETPAMHKMEMKGIKGIGKQLKSHAGKPASKAHAGLKNGGMATGGVRMGAGGFKTGGVVKGKAGGYKTGGVALENAGGFKKGGAAKKFADGGRVDSGRAVSMPQGHKKPTPSVATNLVAGTFKKGGKVAHKEEGGYMDETKAYERWKANEKAENLADRDAMSNLPSKVMDFGSRVVNKIGEKLKGLGKGAISNTEREITKTVIPAKKRGGMC
tara:strand:- start:1151 stop:2146 length:996 start_codon:yes stop_codon:yes gene_type:complete